MATVNELYQEVFGRDVGKEGSDFYGDKLASGEITDTQLRAILMASPEREYRQDLANPWIDEIYQRELGRDARREGEEFYANVDPAKAAAGIRASAEAQAYRASGVPETTPTGEAGAWPTYTESSNDMGRGEGLFVNPYTSANTEVGAEYLASQPAGAPAGGPVGDPAYTGGRQGSAWDWASLSPERRGGGGYDPAEYAFDRYVPGQDSPWGQPEIEGGNKEFYRNQFTNLLADEQGYRDRQGQAASRAQEALDNPVEGLKPDWSWLEGGAESLEAPAVQWGGETDAAGNPTGQSRYNLNPLLNRDMSNWEVTNVLAPYLTSDTNNVMTNHAQASPDATGWMNQGQFNNPQQLAASLDPNLNAGAKSAFNDVFNQMYQRSDLTTPAGGGPSPAPGYASPI
jgi:hypothetical protein